MTLRAKNGWVAQVAPATWGREWLASTPGFAGHRGASKTHPTSLLIALYRCGVAVASFGLLLAGCHQPARVQRKLLPGLSLDLPAHTVEATGQVCIKQGILEYIAVSQGGKTYESLFVLDARPSHLQTLLLLAGMQTGEVSPAMRGDFAPQVNPSGIPQVEGAPAKTPPSGKYLKAAGDEPTLVCLVVVLQDDSGQWVDHPVEQFLIDRHTGQPPDKLIWAFTGSFFQYEPQVDTEVYLADIEKSVVALWYDSTALLNLAQDVGNPYRGVNLGLEVNRETLPPKGTPIRLRFVPQSRP